MPVSRRFGDPYYSLQDGLSESTHVFVEGNALRDRFTDGFAIAETGFGTGLNLCAALLAWEMAGTAGRFAFTSFEAYPLSAEEIAIALGPWSAIARWRAILAETYRADGAAFAVGPADVRIIPGDARETIPAWEGRADAWFLDGFAPARNPEMWEPALLAAVAAHTRPRGSFATFTAAGAVRRSLAEAGFTVERISGYGRKRHMCRGVLDAPVTGN